MSKQTATEYLIQEIKNDALVQAKSTEEWNEVFQKAKQMECEQNEYFFNCGRQYQLTGEGTFKQVHNETYGGQDE